MEDPEEILSALKEDGVELTDEGLEKVSGSVERTWNNMVICNA